MFRRGDPTKARVAPSRVAGSGAIPKTRSRGRVMDLVELTRIARGELAKHGLRGWTFALSNTKRRLGVCKYRSKRIEIAEFHAQNNPPELVLDTLQHEIAHAIAGASAKHGPAWKAVALRLGATPRACDTSSETVVTPGDWRATCASCEKTYHRYRRPKTLSGYRCRCPSRSPLVFEFMGDPALKPFVPMTLEESANWQARCPGCGIVHHRVRKPRLGIWKCGCRFRSELSWIPRPGVPPQS